MHSHAQRDRSHDWDAIVVAGGRASRLGGIDKTALLFDGASLFERAVSSVSAARATVVVGPQRADVADARYRSVLEQPRFSGPAAATIAGLAALASGRSPWTVVIAADQPLVADAVPRLLAERSTIDAQDDGVIAIDADGRSQPLLAVYRTAALLRASGTAVQRSGGSAAGLPMMKLLAELTVRPLPLGALCADVDDASDAASHGIELPLAAMELQHAH